MLLSMPSSRLAKVLLYLGALLAVVEMTATLLSVSRCVRQLAGYAYGGLGRSCGNGLCPSGSAVDRSVIGTD
eukprot:COSAG02_NODE_3554_length_6570_cov_734.214959_5_plen_72_part_00